MKVSIMSLFFVSILLVSLSVHAAEPVVVKLQPSQNLCSTEELRLPVSDESVILNPQMFSSWAAVFQAHPNKLDYLLVPGDYTSWGPVSLLNKSGTLNRKRTIRYYDPATNHLHPVQRNQEARIDTISAPQIGTAHWLIHGLTIRQPSAAVQIGNDTHNITFESMLIEESRVYGLRIRSAKDICIQNSVIRNVPIEAQRDSTGISIKPALYKPVSRIKILDNEIYNYGDAIQITDHGPNPADSWVPVENVLIENNDLYLTNDRRQADGTACAENGIDIKAGSDNAYTRVYGNRMWGFRKTDTACAGSGSNGDAMVLHVAARRIEIERNIIGEAPVGIKEKLFLSPTNTYLSRYIKANNNYFYNIQKYHVDDSGAVLDLSNNVSFISNVVAQGDYLFDHSNDGGYHLGGPDVRGTLSISVDVNDPASSDPIPVPYDVSINYVKDESKAVAYTYERRRWTGPEYHVIERGY